MITDLDNNSILVYRRFLHRLYYLASIILWVSVAVIYRLNYQQIDELGWLQGGIKLLILASVPVGLWLRLFIVIRPRIFSKLWLDGNSLWIQFKKKKSEIHYSQIKSLKASLLPPKFFGGFQVELHSGKKLFFSSLLKNDFLILQGIRKYNPNLLPHDEFQLLITRTQTCDAYWTRVLRKLENKFYLFYKILVLPSLSLGAFFYLNTSDWMRQRAKDLPQDYSFYIKSFFVIFCIQSFLGIITSHYTDEVFLRKSSLQVLSDEKYSRLRLMLNILSEFLVFSLGLSAGVLYLFWCMGMKLPSSPL